MKKTLQENNDELTTLGDMINKCNKTPMGSLYLISVYKNQHYILHRHNKNFEFISISSGIINTQPSIEFDSIDKALRTFYTDGANFYFFETFDEYCEKRKELK